MLSVVCFRWTPVVPYRSVFLPETVHTLRRMVARHYPHPHRFICVTDSRQGLARDIEVVPLWKDLATVPNPMNQRRPSCYRRLKLFDPAMAAIVGPRVVWLDLDCVITGDLSPLWNRDDEIVLWGGTHQKTPYNGSMVLMTVGCRSKVWTEFHPILSPRRTRSAGLYGSDQAWLSYKLGPREARWTQADGVYSFRCDVELQGVLPADARVVFFHGPLDPWRPDVQAAHPWIKEHYQ
jgi:hypothetical protein